MERTRKISHVFRNYILFLLLAVVLPACHITDPDDDCNQKYSAKESFSYDIPTNHQNHFAIENIKQVMDLTASLSPTTYTLHLPYGEIDFEKERIKRWKERTYRSMDTLCTFGFNCRTISIETLNYPLQWVEEI